MKPIKVLIGLLHLLFIIQYLTLIDGKAQYVMPLLGGMKMSLPYDIANVFIRPVASTISVALSITMLYVLVFGVITSPFGYMFGIPSRKYVLGGPTNPIDSPSARSLNFMDFEFSNSSWFFNNENKNDIMFPKFEDQVFYLLSPEVQIEPCRLLALCHAHNAVQKLPESLVKIVRIFSEKLIDLSSEHKEAIKIGLRNEVDCSDVYSNCKESGYTIVGKTLLYWLPKSMKNHSHRRKQAMYMKNKV